MRNVRVDSEVEPPADSGWLASVLSVLDWSHRDAVAFVVAIVASAAILINVLLLQSGPHPAPIFERETIAATAAQDTAAVAPRSSRSIEPRASKSEPQVTTRPGPEITAVIQRELAARGFFDGVVDGRHGPHTDSAIRNFAAASGIKINPEPSETLLATIKHSNVKAAKTPALASPPRTVAATQLPRPPQPIRSDPIAELLAPSKRVLAVQWALADFGYGQIKPTGIVDTETRAAIEKFERERSLPITGTVSDRVIRELASITGRSMD